MKGEKRGKKKIENRCQNSRVVWRQINKWLLVLYVGSPERSPAEDAMLVPRAELSAIGQKFAAGATSQLLCAWSV